MLLFHGKHCDRCYQKWSTIPSTLSRLIAIRAHRTLSLQSPLVFYLSQVLKDLWVYDLTCYHQRISCRGARNTGCFERGDFVFKEVKECQHTSIWLIFPCLWGLLEFIRDNRSKRRRLQSSHEGAREWGSREGAVPHFDHLHYFNFFGVITLFADFPFLIF